MKLAGWTVISAIVTDFVAAVGTQAVLTGFAAIGTIAVAAIAVAAVDAHMAADFRITATADYTTVIVSRQMRENYPLGHLSHVFD